MILYLFYSKFNYCFNFFFSFLCFCCCYLESFSLLLFVVVVINYLIKIKLTIHWFLLIHFWKNNYPYYIFITSLLFFVIKYYLIEVKIIFSDSCNLNSFYRFILMLYTSRLILINWFYLYIHLLKLHCTRLLSHFCSQSVFFLSVEIEFLMN